MINSEKELEVRNLVVSFRTNKGLVHAVRDINLTLNKGETLAIVGESGSGKSVTAKAVLGIESPNAVIENGEILYHGQNLLTFTEDEYNKIRGNKITMIFQDPMSSLDPIVKIGPQMTEATLLNGKTNQKNASKEFRLRLGMLQKCFAEYGVDGKEQITTFKKFVKLGSRHLAAYNSSVEYADSVKFDISSIKNELLEEDKYNISDELFHLGKKMERLYGEYFVTKTDAVFAPIAARFYEEAKNYSTANKNVEALKESLDAVSDHLDVLLARTAPNFFTLGYYLMAHGSEGVDFTDVNAMNEKLRKIIDEEYMSSFIANISKAIKNERERCYAANEEALKALGEASKIFESEEWNLKECRAEIARLSKIVNTTVNRLSLYTDRAVYTLEGTLRSATEKYAATPLSAHSLARSAIADLVEYYNKEQSERTDYDEQSEFEQEAVAIIDHLKDLSAAMVYHITKQMAYDKAIRIMEEVGIREPRKRFNQYPFEFSGGMRQRIVIAIAIAAAPDLLICDEPTTALDVTIQAQIIELINKIKTQRKMSVIFITHDLGVVANVADRIAVMYAGKVVETGTAEDIFYHPAHPYTWALLASMPDLDTKDKLDAIPGTPPNMLFPPKGDAFAARNQYAMEIDFEEQPPMFQISETHYAATWLLHPDAPKVEPPKTVTDRIERMKAKESLRKESNNGN